MEKILKIEAEKRERQRRILRSLNLDDGKNIRVVGEQSAWRPTESFGVQGKKVQIGEMQEIYCEKPYSFEETGTGEGEHSEGNRQMKKQQSREAQSRQAGEESQSGSAGRTGKANRSGNAGRTGKTNRSGNAGRTEMESLSEELGRIIREKQDGKTRQGQKEKWSGEIKGEKAVLQSHGIQCAALSVAALILAGMAVFQEAGSRTKTVNSSPNRIVTAATEQAGTSVSAEPETFTVSSAAEGAGAGVLILVNKDNPLPEDYTVELHWLKNGRVAVADEIYDALSAMLTDGSTDGREFVVASGYRSYERQQELLEEDIQAAMEKYGLTWQEAYDRESQETMPEGCSEHETGLAVDLVALDYQLLDAAQEYTEENQWLQEHCQEYGFILRYPRGKEDVTGISYESWHFRYVGTEAAEVIMERGITLEEYLSEIG